MDAQEPVVRRIDCDDCMMQGTSTCADCVVTFLCTRDDDGVAVVDVAEARALRLLHSGGLAPALRHRSSSAASTPSSRSGSSWPAQGLRRTNIG
jgi:hypothetical protein